MSTPRPYHRPVKLTDTFFENRKGGEDPAALNLAAHSSAHALVSRGRKNLDPEVTHRLVTFTDVFGLETIASMWKHAPAISLPGALWRMYALRNVVRKNTAQIALYYERGMNSDWVSRLVSGVADPPTEQEVISTADQILTGAYTGEFDIALERFAAFCRVVSAGQEATAAFTEPGTYQPKTGAKDDESTGSQDSTSQPSPEVRQEAGRRALRLRDHAKKLRGTALELEAAAAKWRAKTLD